MISQSAIVSQPLSRTSLFRIIPKSPVKSIPYSVIFVILASTILVSILVFPERYSLLTHPISKLGSPVLNPQGHLWFRTGVCLTCIFKIGTLIAEIRVQEDHTPVSIVISVLEIVANLGFAGIALIPEERYCAHFILAAVAFYGYVAWLIGISWRQFFDGRWISRFGELSWISKGIVFSVIAVGMLIMLTWTAKFKMAPSNLLGGSPFLQFAPWEWLTFISICSWDWYLHYFS